MIEFFILLIIAIFGMYAHDGDVLKGKVKSAESFYITGKEYKCGFSDKQIGINKYEKKIQDLIDQEEIP